MPALAPSIGPTLIVRSVGNTMIVRERGGTPRDEDWDEFLAQLSRNRDRFETLRILVMTDGGGPNADQRKRLERVLEGRPVRVAVVTDSSKARFIAAMITLLNKQLRGFSTKEIALAYQHLGLTSAEQKLTEAVLRELNELMSKFD